LHSTEDRAVPVLASGASGKSRDERGESLGSSQSGRRHCCREQSRERQKWCPSGFELDRERAAKRAFPGVVRNPRGGILLPARDFEHSLVEWRRHGTGGVHYSISRSASVNSQFSGSVRRRPSIDHGSALSRPSAGASGRTAAVETVGSRERDTVVSL